MKRIIVRLTISLLTFTLGFIAVWITSSLLFKQTEPLPTTQTIEFPESENSGFKLPKFMTVSRGCGMGYIQTYSTSDFQHFSEGVTTFETTKKAQADLKKRLTNAVLVIERIPQYNNRHNKTGERIVLISLPESPNNGKETASILWYGGGSSIWFIEAPSLELVLEFERYLEAKNFPTNP